MIPTTPALDAAIADLSDRCRPYLDPTKAIAEIRRLQHEASTTPTFTPGATP